MSEEAPTLITEEVSISKLGTMLYELIKRNPVMTVLIICLIGVVVYYFVNVRPLKGSSFTHDHEHYQHTMPSNLE
jgi:hypothetical protein